MTNSVAVIGNTTSPATDLIMTGPLINSINLVRKEYGNVVFGFQGCPLDLFVELVRINHLRFCATKPNIISVDECSSKAFRILDRVTNFSPDAWAKAKPSRNEDWMHLGYVYQAAVLLYAILSLQSLSILPRKDYLSDICVKNSLFLHELLERAIKSPRIKRFLLWPLLVLGVEAVNRDQLMRSFVRQNLKDLSNYVGFHVPLRAKIVLERFWASNETSWEMCFNEPRAFAMHIAIDISGMSPSV